MAGELGSGRYVVEFAGRCGGAVICRVEEYSDLSFGRVMGDTSQAQLTVVVSGATMACCSCLAELHPWCDDMFVYRDGNLVWSGPVVTKNVNSNQVVIDARDVTAWLDRRVVHRALNFTTDAGADGLIDPAVLAGILLADALEPDDPCLLDFVQLQPTDVTASYKTDANSTQTGAALRDLVKSGMTFFALGQMIWVGPDTVTDPIATLRDEDFVGQLGYSEDGLTAATKTYVVGSAVTGAAAVSAPAPIGVAGSPGECGLLESVTNDTSITDQATADRVAAVDLSTSWPPKITITSSVQRLAPCAPLSFDELVPPLAINVALRTLCQPLDATLALTKVDVSFGPEGESVGVTLNPTADLSGVVSGGLAL